MRSIAEIIFWLAALPILWTQAGYALILQLLVSLKRPAGRGGEPVRSADAPRAARAENATPAGVAQAAGAAGAAGGAAKLPTVSLIIAAHDEQAVIAEKVLNALAQSYPREQLQVIVSCDGCSDRTAELARSAGADLVLELPRGGKVRAQDAAVQRASGELLAFSDANSTWQPQALQTLVEAFADPSVGYACGQVRFLPAEGADATSQEGLYWRFELAMRERESKLRSITAGNGAIYATRKQSYITVDPVMGHDLSFPFNMVKRGWRAIYVPAALATEKLVPSIEGEFARKRRMMSHTWPIVLRGGLASPRGYGAGYALMIFSHRLLRYASPFLHLLALLASLIAVSLSAGPFYIAVLWLQGVFVLAAALGGRWSLRGLLIARHYLLSTSAIAFGLSDWLRHGTDAAWQAAEGTR